MLPAPPLLISNGHKQGKIACPPTVSPPFKGPCDLSFSLSLSFANSFAEFSSKLRDQENKICRGPHFFGGKEGCHRKGKTAKEESEGNKGVRKIRDLPGLWPTLRSMSASFIYHSYITLDNMMIFKMRWKRFVIGHHFMAVTCFIAARIPTSFHFIFCFRSTFLITTVCPCRSVVRPGHFLQRFLPDDLGNQDEPHSPGQGG